jgi:hypothetical protein
MNEPQKAAAKISVVMEFTETGYLQSVLLNAQNQGDEEVLGKALNRLLKPNHFSWVRRLFKR